jgi:hypothetical protein
MISTSTFSEILAFFLADAGREKKEKESKRQKRKIGVSSHDSPVLRCVVERVDTSRL